VKDFLIDRISGIRPGISGAGGGGARNATIRRQGLLAFRGYPAFLSNHAPAAYTAVMQRYIEDNRLYLASTVKVYMTGLAMATQRRERSLLVTSSEMAGRSFNSRLGSMFLPSVHLPLSVEPLAQLCVGHCNGWDKSARRQFHAGKSARRQLHAGKSARRQFHAGPTSRPLFIAPYSQKIDLSLMMRTLSLMMCTLSLMMCTLSVGMCAPMCRQVRSVSQ
jgi:hypothetical protein